MGADSLQYDSRLYDVESHLEYVSDNGYPAQWAPFNWNILYAVTNSGGWTYNAGNYGIVTEVKPDARTWDPECQPYDAKAARYRLLLPDGSQHLLYLRGYEDMQPEPLSAGDGFVGINLSGLSDACARHYGWPQQIASPLKFYTNDGSYLRLDYYTADHTWKLYYPDGRRVVNENYEIKEYDATFDLQDPDILNHYMLWAPTQKPEEPIM